MPSENEEILLIELDAKNEYNKINTRIKVKEIKQTITVSSGKRYKKFW